MELKCATRRPESFLPMANLTDLDGEFCSDSVGNGEGVLPAKTDYVVERVRDVDIPRAVHRQAGRHVKLRLRG